MSLNPTDGVRVLLELTEVVSASDGSSLGARYAGELLTPATSHPVAVSFDAAGVPRLDADAAAPPEPRALELMRAIARTVGRGAVAQTPPSWPRRVLRWRRP